MQKHMLVFMRHFPPLCNISAVRNAAIIYSFLQSNNYRITLCMPKPRLQSSDQMNSFLQSVLKHPRLTIIFLKGQAVSAAVDYFFDYRKYVRGRDTVGYYLKTRLKRLCKELLRPFLKLLYFPDDHYLWARRNYRYIDSLVRKDQPDIIYSSSMPFSNHLLGRHVAAKHQIPWVAEVHDFFVGNHMLKDDKSGFSVWLRTRLQKSVLDAANTVVTVSQGAIDYLKEQGVASPFLLVSNGYVSQEFCEAQYEKHRYANADDLLITFVGSIFHPQYENLQFCMQCLNKLAAEIQQKIVFVLPGNHSKAVLSMIKAQLTNSNIKFKKIDRLQRQDAINLMVSADVLLYFNVVTPGYDGVCSVKIFEYASAGKSFWFFAKNQKDQPSLINLVRSFGAKIITNNNDLDCINDVLNVCSIEHREVIKKYSLESQAQKFLSLMNSLCMLS